MYLQMPCSYVICVTVYALPLLIYMNLSLDNYHLFKFRKFFGMLMTPEALQSMSVYLCSYRDWHSFETNLLTVSTIILARWVHLVYELQLHYSVQRDISYVGIQMMDKLTLIGPLSLRECFIRLDMTSMPIVCASF